LPELRVIRQRDKLSGRATSPQTAAQATKQLHKSSDGISSHFPTNTSCAAGLQAIRRKTKSVGRNTSHLPTITNRCAGIQVVRRFYKPWTEIICCAAEKQLLEEPPGPQKEDAA